MILKNESEIQNAPKIMTNFDAEILLFGKTLVNLRLDIGIAASALRHGHCLGVRQYPIVGLTITIEIHDWRGY